MNSINENNFMNFEIPSDPTSLTITILVSLIIGLAIALIYTKVNVRSEYTKSFAFTLAVTTAIMAAVSMTIGSNIAVSIGLFGILSILRFRASVKSIKDMAYLLLSVAIGLTVGSQNFMLTLLLLTAFILILLLFKFYSSTQINKNEFLLIITGNSEVRLQTISNVLGDLNISFQIKTSTCNLESGKQELTISISSADIDQLNKFTALIKSITGIESVSLITPYSTLDD